MTPEMAIAFAILALLVVIVVTSMARSWRTRAERSSATLPAPPEVPAEPGAARTAALEGTYVSTTSAGDWLARVHGHDLGTRSAAVVRVHDAGVAVTREGARDLFVPAADVLDAHRAPGQAGKFVGGQGLVVVRWTLHGPDGDVVLDTGLRLRRAEDRDALTAAVAALVAERDDTPPTAPAPTEEPS